MNVKFAITAAFFFSFFYFSSKYPDMPIVGILIVSIIIGAAQILIFGNLRGGSTSTNENVDANIKNPKLEKITKYCYEIFKGDASVCMEEHGWKWDGFKWVECKESIDETKSIAEKD